MTIASLPADKIKALSFVCFLIGQIAVFPAFSQNKKAVFDEKYGKILSEIIEKQVGVYEKESVENLVDTIGQKLANHLTDPLFHYQFKILDMQDPNAFSLPGGYVYVTRGLLTLVNNEDELAGVIGHEIIHSHNRHVYRQMKTGVLSDLLQLPANVAGSVLGNELGSVINAPFVAGGQLLMSRYSKKNEKEADVEGIWLAAQSGYDPLALYNILESIKISAELQTGKSEEKDYFSQHPYTPKRLEYIRDHAAEMDFTNHDPIFKADHFLDLLNGLTVGENPDRGILVDNVYLHPGKKISITFPKGWRISNISKTVWGTTDNEEALVLLSLSPEKKKPEKAAREFLSMVSQKNVDLLNTKSLEINGLPAYLVTLQAFIEDRVMFCQNLWIESDSVTYNLIGTGTQDYLEELKGVGLSFGEVDEEALAEIKTEVLKIVKAKKGEDLEALYQRTNGATSIEYLEVINGMDKNKKLKSGQKVKMIVEKNYLKEGD